MGVSEKSYMDFVQTLIVALRNANRSIAAQSQAIPNPGASDGIANPPSLAMPAFVTESSCGMYSTHGAFGTAAHRLTCSSIKKCGQIGTLKLSARCAHLSQGVMPPMRATSA